jgi:hypothetical protein
MQSTVEDASPAKTTQHWALEEIEMSSQLPTSKLKRIVSLY